MYAIVRAGGHQEKVSIGDEFDVNRLAEAPGDTVSLPAVLIVADGTVTIASGGPAGVGQASGRAIRASLVAIVVLNFLMTVAIWGLNPALPFRG